MATISKQHQEESFFFAVDNNNIGQIITLIQGKVDINAIGSYDKCNALQKAFFLGTLKVETCRCLIQNGIDLEYLDPGKHTILAQVTAYCAKYRIKEILGQQTPSLSFNFDKVSALGLFQAILEAGADATVDSTSGCGRSMSEEVARHPELKAIVQEVSRKTAEKVFSVLPGEWGITRIVCDYLSRDPGERAKRSTAALPACMPTDWDSASPSLLQMAASGAGQIAKLLRAQQINL